MSLTFVFRKRQYTETAHGTLKTAVPKLLLDLKKSIGEVYQKL